jgi:hypothetical protein
MAGSTIKVDGLEALKKKFGSIPQNVKTEVNADLSSVSKEYEGRAVEQAPIDVGGLRQGITSAKVADMDYEVTSHSPYSAYIEFGTKRRVKVPADLTAYAAQFKGKGGGSQQGFYDAILAWVKRKGIAGTYSVKTKRRTGSKIDKQIEDEQTAFAIYLSILRHGINAQPFFFPHLPWAKSEVLKRSAEAVKRALEA